MASREELISRLCECVVDRDDDEVVAVAQAYIDAGFPAYDGIMEGLVAGMGQASDLYDAGEYFVTDVLLCSHAMYAGLDVLRPHLPVEQSTGNARKAVIGVVQYDTHDIGKNLLKAMLDTAGFQVYDLGRDVELEEFPNKAEEVGADLICMTSLMSTAIGGMAEVMDMLRERGIRDKYVVMVGGAAVSQAFCKQIGADIYAESAIDAVKAAKAALGM